MNALIEHLILLEEERKRLERCENLTNGIDSELIIFIVANAIDRARIWAMLYNKQTDTRYD